MRTGLNQIVITSCLFLGSLVLVGCSPSEAKIDGLLAQLVENDRAIDQGAYNALITIGSKASQSTVAHLKAESNPWKQRYYLVLLQEIGDASITGDLLPYASSNDIEVKETALQILAKVGNEHSIDTLINALSDRMIEDTIKEVVTTRLASLTGYDLPYDASASSLERIQVIRGWHEWQKNQPKDETAE